METFWLLINKFVDMTSNVVNINERQKQQQEHHASDNFCHKTLKCVLCPVTF